MKALFCPLGIAFFLAACSSRTEEVGTHLQPLASCADVEARVRASAMAQMNQLVNRYDMGSGLGYRGTGPVASSAPTSSTGATQYSTTNNQVPGVDEADLVKNDEQYIYLVSGGAFRIILAWPPPRSREIARVRLDGTPRKLFVNGNRALVYSSLTGNRPADSGGGPGARPTDFNPNRECTYGYSCSFTGDGFPTKTSIFDITDRSAPKLVRELTASGSYVNSRRIGSAVYTLFNSAEVQFPGIRYFPDELRRATGPWSDSAIHAAFERQRAQNREIIETTPIGDQLPSVTETFYRGGNPETTWLLLDGCTKFYSTTRDDGAQFMTLVSLDMSTDQPARTTTIVSPPGAVYASGDALYLAVPHDRAQGNGWFAPIRAYGQATTVHEFGLSSAPPAASYLASGVVKGRVLNQFSMDQHSGYFRIATTTPPSMNQGLHSTVFVLARNGSDLVVKGAVDDLSPGEDIRSVRFDGDRGYVVTFKKTDPLFVLDLAQPDMPRVLAEIQVPGFSTYIHRMDDGNLLTIGYDADDQGSFAWFAGVRLQIFDVRSPTDPKLLHAEVIGTRGSSSDALTNHLAFTYFAPLNLLALPLNICEGGSGWMFGRPTFSGLLVYDVTADGGFRSRGRVSYPSDSSTTCNNWWTSPSSTVQRSIVMDDYLFSLSEQLLKVNRLNDLSVDVASLNIGN